MSDSHKIPITNKATGEVTLGEPAKGQTTSADQTTRPESSSAAIDVSGQRAQETSEGASAEGSGTENQAVATKSPGESAPAGSKETPRQQIESLEQFIAYAYSRQGQRITLKPAVEKALCRNPKLEPEARRRLLEVASDDVLLAVPRQLLLVVRDVVGFLTLKNEVRDFVGDVLAMHPAFSSSELAAALRNLPSSPDPEQALAMLAATDFSILKGLVERKPLKRRELSDLRINATYCLAVWFADTRGLSVDKLNQYLFSSLWKPSTRIAKDDTARLRFLTEIRDLTGVGLASSAFKQQADEQAQVAAVARRTQETALAKLQTLNEAVEQLRQDIEDRDQQIAALSQAIKSEERSHEQTRTHLRDDFEQLRTRLLRRLKAEVNLLTEGLHALRRDPPKIHVIDDHAERALEGLKKEIRELESEG